MPDAAARRPPELTSADGLEAVLPAAGEWAAAFVSMADEPEMGGLLHLLAARDLRLLVPAPGPHGKDLAWTRIRPATCALPAVAAGTVPNPPGPRFGPAALTRCALILVPALAVDRSGTRLGRGGGWYDRALEYASDLALVLAVCLDAEVLPAGRLPREPHDQPVDGVLTPTAVTLF
jgi:5-formyltetrahydrofolate cyclo-ligase